MTKHALIRTVVTAIATVGSILTVASAQVVAPPSQAQERPPAPPPATKLEAFRPSAGSVITLGYTNLGRVSGVSVDVREMGQARASGARGVLVEVTQSEYREERSFVDADELPELLRGFDALLEVKANPTPFKNFEVRYTTKGELELTAYNDLYNAVRYAVRAGRTLRAQKTGLDEKDLRKLRALFDSAQGLLTKLPTRP